MTISNMLELAILVCSIPAAAFIIVGSNRKVKDLDGLGEVVKQEGKKGAVVAHF